MWNSIGNTVQIGDRPSAVIGDKRCMMPLWGFRPNGKVQSVG